ncbi:MAG: hypothetical protein HUJ86_04790 [Synergistes sp.]|nr:hypothetical protein [Synergistes sp.]
MLQFCSIPFLCSKESVWRKAQQRSLEKRTEDGILIGKGGVLKAFGALFSLY